ncbi:MAG: carbohydrate kinase [Bacteroidetes bacterium]|nr:MAG: carbohydrate kinase [Bacteroidota bacterium]
MTDFSSIFADFKNARVGVVGDVMLDTYWWGHVERISPEAPVPIVSLDKKEFRIGGAGNVALNLASLGVSVNVFSVIGQDENGATLESLFTKNNIQTGYLLRSSSRITTNKSRIISRNQQMMRLDAETTQDLSKADEDAIIQSVENYLANENPHVMIFEDYNKGILTDRVIREIIKLSKKNHVITAVDPKRKNFFSYEGVDIFKPNVKEVKEGLNILTDHLDLDALKKIHQQLSDILHHRISFITLSEKGVFYQFGEEAKVVASHLRNIADVSGAGDTVIAVAALIFALTHNVDLMAEIANVAGGLVCEEVGTVAVDKSRLLKECEMLLN